MEYDFIEYSECELQDRYIVLVKNNETTFIDGNSALIIPGEKSSNYIERYEQYKNCGEIKSSLGYKTIIKDKINIPENLLLLLKSKNIDNRLIGFKILKDELYKDSEINF